MQILCKYVIILIEVFRKRRESDIMEENLKVDLTKVDKEKKILYFKKMIKILEANAKEQNEPVEKIINDFISDLSNIGKEGYIRKVGNIGVVLTKETLGNCIKYMKKEAKRYKQIANNDKKKTELQQKEGIWQEIEDNIDKIVLQGKQGTKKEIVQRLIEGIDSDKFEYEFKSKEKKFVLKKLKGIVNEINKKEEEEKRKEEEKKRKEEEEKVNKRETEKRNAEKAMEQIQAIAKKYKVEDMPKFLSSIKDSVTGANTDIDLNIKIGKEAQEYLLEMIDDKIKEEKDELYFEQVKKFTKGFQFLKEYSEVVRARCGASKMNKFTDLESYYRFCSLRELLQKEYDESIGIQILLDSNGIDDADRRILTERKKIVDKEIERKSRIKEEGIR